MPGSATVGSAGLLVSDPPAGPWVVGHNPGGFASTAGATYTPG